MCRAGARDRINEGPRPAHQGPADRQHLLLATREAARHLPAAFLQARDVAVQLIHPPGHVAAASAMSGGARPMPGWLQRMAKV